MQPKFRKRISLTLAALLLSMLVGALQPTRSAYAQNETYLPWVGTPQEQVQPNDSEQQAGTDAQPSFPIVDEVERPDARSGERMNVFDEAVELDTPSPVGEESTKQDGDGAYAEQPQGELPEWSDVLAAAFHANNWYVQNKLGVGTDSPTHRIEVNANWNWVNRFLIRNNYDGNSVASEVYMTTGTAAGLMLQKFGSGFNQYNWSGIALADWARIRTDSNVNGLIQTTASGPMYFGTNDTERLRIHSGGGLTIRNTNDTFGLRVQDATNIGMLVEDSGFDGIQIHNAGLDGIYIYGSSADGVEINGPAEDGLEVYDAGDDGVYVDNPGIDGVYINDAGDDGVDIVNPGDDGVHVLYSVYNSSRNGVRVYNGDIVVDGTGSFIDSGTALNVPDYVFEDDYPLMSLNEVRAYVEANKHLPNVPSEEEIHANGIDLSEFHMRLLEKVEELTLYTLQQQDVIDTQQAQIEALETRLAAVEAQE